MEVLGTVARLQVQRGRLKPGPRGARRYDPAPLLQVEALEIGPRGVVGVAADGERLVDVHHADHPDTRNVKLRNGVSLLPRPHYALLRERFGPGMRDGVAGESILLDTEGPLAEGDLSGRLALETTDGAFLELAGVTVASPCVEFTRFVLGRQDLDVDDEVRMAMPALDGGMRGFYVTALGAGRIEKGARLLRLPRA
jgi:hypothetical protein